jgi:DnaJ homolog subfamily A member 2
MKAFAEGVCRGRDRMRHATMSLEELYTGKTTKVPITRHIICQKCCGKERQNVTVHSDARGNPMFRDSMLGQNFQLCHGYDEMGERMGLKKECENCKDKKVVTERKFLDVHVKKGMRNGERIIIYGESDQCPDLIPGDVVVVIEEEWHRRFVREGDNLKTEVEIDATMALAGGSITIRQLDGRMLSVDIVPGTKEGEKQNHGIVGCWYYNK